MPPLREQQLDGLAYLEAVTTLLQRIRRAHPTAGLWEAADRQWSWRNPRPTDSTPQLFWFDDDGRPAAACITTHSAFGVAFDPMVMPDSTPDRIAHVVGRGLEHASACGFEAVELEVDRADGVMRELLLDRGFVVREDGAVEAWMAADARPEVSAIADGYTLSCRSETKHRSHDTTEALHGVPDPVRNGDDGSSVLHGVPDPVRNGDDGSSVLRGVPDPVRNGGGSEAVHRVHHMASERRGHPDPEPRLLQTSLYRPDLDLVVHDADGSVAAYGLFWYDPVTATGLVEPMRTEDPHQRRGLARHVLTAGIERLAEAGADRIKIVYDPGHPASGHLYRSVGFEPHRHTDVLTGPTTPTGSSDPTREH